MNNDVNSQSHTPTPIGRSTPRLEDERFLVGAGRYVADTDAAGQLHAVVVRSQHAHGEIRNIDASAAARVPGVVAIHTASDLRADGVGVLPCMADFETVSPLVRVPRHALAAQRVRHVGEPVVLVLAQSRQAAEDAAEQVDVDVRPLDAVCGIDDALANGAPELWEAAARNLAFHMRRGDAAATRAIMDGAVHVVHQRVVNQRVSAVPLEPRAAVASYDARRERFALHCNAQGLHAIRAQLATVFGLPAEHFHLSAPDVGGGFGLKNFLYPEWVLLAFAARRHACSVRWVAERGEDFSGAAHGRDSQTEAWLALDGEGRFLALHVDMTANMGAYLSGSGPNVSTRAFPTALGGIYAIAQASMDARGVFTNTTPVDAYRGAGKPEANYFLERLIDAAAHAGGFDPVELRLRNAITAFPYRSPLGTVIDSARFRSNIEAACDVVERGSFAERRAQAAGEGRLLGLGVACFLETARGAPEEGAHLRLHTDGTVELTIGTESHGQGHHTAYAQVLAARLGVSVHAVRFVQADTALVVMGHGHGGARSMHMGGTALVAAIDGLLAKARVVAAGLLQAPAASVSFAAGHFGVANSERSISLSEVAASLPEAGVPDGASIEHFEKVEDAPFTFPSGCHAAEVEVDPDTGEVAIRRYVAVDDYGVLINPMLTLGQVHGGVAQGLGQAMGEQIVYAHDSGQLLSGSLMDYALPRADDFPEFEVSLQGAPTAANPLGVKGSGQAGAIAAPQTLVNAVLNALAPLGVKRLDMPLSAERVWRAIRDA